MLKRVLWWLSLFFRGSATFERELFWLRGAGTDQVEEVHVDWPEWKVICWKLGIRSEEDP